MPFQQPDSIRYFTFESLQDKRVTHAIFTRRGGISPSPWDTLNMGATVGDDLSRVQENRKRALRELNQTIDSVFDVWQVHSSVVAISDSPKSALVTHQKADAILTDRPGVTLMMRFADCVPIFLYDPICHVVGIVHAGWQGTVGYTAEAAVATMQARFASRPENVIAAIGPSIGAHHYPIGSDVVEKVNQTFRSNAAFLLSERDGEVQFDLWAANRLILEQCGINQIEIAGLCTACQLDDWYSHRGEHGKTGRFGAAIALVDR
jgi:YfiH family protein